MLPRLPKPVADGARRRGSGSNGKRAWNRHHEETVRGHRRSDPGRAGARLERTWPHGRRPSDVAPILGPLAGQSRGDPQEASALRRVPGGTMHGRSHRTRSNRRSSPPQLRTRWSGVTNSIVNGSGDRPRNPMYGAIRPTARRRPFDSDETKSVPPSRSQCPEGLLPVADSSGSSKVRHRRSASNSQMPFAARGGAAIRQDPTRCRSSSDRALANHRQAAPRAAKATQAARMSRRRVMPTR
jgi:hypothetical protein